jgi:hypothetical protein
MKINKLLTEYRDLGNSKQHKENADFAQDFLKIMNENPNGKQVAEVNMQGRHDQNTVEGGLIQAKKILANVETVAKKYWDHKPQQELQSVIQALHKLSYMMGSADWENIDQE